ncbi:MAG: calcium/proton exchanger [Herpetosiphon sp.]
MHVFARGERITLVVAIVATAATGVIHFQNPETVLAFAVSAVALAALAAIVGQATEHIGALLGPGATGVLQAGIGNLPELFVAIFALRRGLVEIVQAALIGSILANSLLVLGLAFLVGGLRHGTLRFDSETPRVIATLTMLSVAALTLPTLAHRLHTPAGAHVEALSIAVAVVLLLVFAASIPFSLQGGPTEVSAEPGSHPGWPLGLAIVVLLIAGMGAAFVSDWFVAALEPAIKVLHLSDAFTGLVIVAIAGNAVEHAVGIRLAAQNKADYAVSVILNSSLQIALGLIPALVLLSFLLGTAHLTLVLPPLLLAVLGLSTLLGSLIIYDGEAIWLEGVTLVGLYGIVAAAFWWG